MSIPRKPITKIGFDSLSDRFHSSLSCDDDNSNKPDFRELDLGSPVSPLRVRQAGATASGLSTTTTSSSSSSSGSVSGRNGQNTVPKKSDSGGNSHSGELSGSVESSPTFGVGGSFRGSKPGHRRSYSSGGSTQTPIFSGGSSANSPTVNVLPAGNICPSGKVLKTGMATRSSRTDVLGSGSGHYGHGSIMRGGAAAAAKSPSGSEIRSAGVANPRGTVTGEPVKKPISNVDSEELKRAGNDYYKRGNFIEALNHYDRAISLSPANASYHCNRAAALMGLKRLPEAVKECNEAIRLDPNYMRAHHRLGSLFLSLGQVENARNHIHFPGNQTDPKELQKLQEIEKHINKCNELRRIGDWRSALRECNAAIASGADSSPQLLAFKAEALLKLGQLDDANTSISCVPKFEIPSASGFLQAKFFGMISDAYPFFVIAQIDMASGRFENAVANAEKAGQMDPKNVEVSVLVNATRSVTRARGRGNDLFKTERFTEACLAYGDGLRFDPSNPVLYCNRAACWYKLGQWEKSLDDCNHALRVQPSYTKALLRRAGSYTKLERWAEAVTDYEVLKRELRHDKDIAECLLRARIALKKSRGEPVDDIESCGEVESVTNLEQFKALVSSPGASVVHFKAASDLHCKQISLFLDTLCSKYPSVNFLKVDVEESPTIANAENVRTVPTIKIYKEGKRVKEMVCPRPEILESSVKHYSC